jgi:hypothetical protein
MVQVHMLTPVQSGSWLYQKMEENELIPMVQSAKHSVQYLQSRSGNTHWAAAKCTSPTFCFISLTYNAPNELKIGRYTI